MQSPDGEHASQDEELPRKFPVETHGARVYRVLLSHDYRQTTLEAPTDDPGQDGVGQSGTVH